MENQAKYFLPKTQEEYTIIAKKMIAELENKAIEREELIRLIVLAIFSRTNMFLIGPPGVGKTYILNIVINSIEGAKSFEYLIMTHTKPEELFGTSYVDKNGKMYYDITNSVLDAHFPFLDEIFKGRSDILNTLLGITHPSRKFFMRGVGEYIVPMVCMFGASNELPQDESLDALDDRFLFRYEVLPIKKIEKYDRFLKGDYDSTPVLSFTITLDDLAQVYKDAIRKIIMPSNVRRLYANLREKLIRNRVKVSDRKINLALDIFKVSAYLNGRNEIDFSDFLILKHILWRDFNEKQIVEEVLHNILFGEVDEIKKEILNIEKELDKINNLMKIEVGRFIYKKEMNSGSDLEEYFNKNIQLLKEVYQIVSILLKQVLLLEERRNFNEFVLKQCEENIFVFDEEKDDLENIKRFLKEDNWEYVFSYKKIILNIVKKTKVLSESQKAMIEEILVYEYNDALVNVRDLIIKTIDNFMINPFNFTSIQHALNPKVISNITSLKLKISRYYKILDKFLKECPDAYSYASFNPIVLNM